MAEMTEMEPPNQTPEDLALTEQPPPAAAMAEAEQPPPPSAAAKHSSPSFSIWPPTDRTRDAVRNRLIETLSTPSVLSKRYGTISPEEAVAAAERIEDEAFDAAGNTGGGGDDDVGIAILQVYSKEISKRMLDTVKARSASETPPEEEEEEDAGPTAPPPRSEKTESVVDDE